MGEKFTDSMKSTTEEGGRLTNAVSSRTKSNLKLAEAEASMQSSAEVAFAAAWTGLCRTGLYETFSLLD